jgi:hypothetical protein
MELQWAQQLFQGKRIDEVMFDIPFMTPDQLGELGLCLFDLTFSMEAGKNDHVYDEVYEAMADRREYYKALRRKFRDDRIAALGGFRHGKHDQVFVKRDDSLAAVQALFGKAAVAVYQEESDHNEEIPEALKVDYSEDQVDLSFDAHQFVIEYSFGARIMFSNSEWASLALLK